MMNSKVRSALATVVAFAAVGCSAGASEEASLIGAPLADDTASTSEALSNGGAQANLFYADVNATPETVRIVPGTLGTSKICFSSNIAYSQVYVSMDGAPDTLFAMERERGCALAPWIQIDHSYEFRIYAGQGHDVILDRVTVRGVERQGGDGDGECGNCRPGTTCACGDGVCRPRNVLCP
jgi:hypothetical protein